MMEYERLQYIVFLQLPLNDLDRYELEDAAGETITMLEDGIAWDADVENKFKRAPNSENV